MMGPRIGCLCITTIALLLVHTIEAQSRPARLALSAGFSSYVGNSDVEGIGALARLTLRLEGARQPVGAQVEGSFHRFVVLPQACPACPGCRCSPQAPPAEVWALRGGAQWHVRGSPGGAFFTGGLGAYTSIGVPGQARGVALGYDLGLGLRRAVRGLYCEARYVRVTNSSTSAWLVPVTVGILF
jgi:hypothetical protein